MSVDNPRRIRAGAFGLGLNHQMTRLGACCELDSWKFTDLTHLHAILTAEAETSMPSIPLILRQRAAPSELPLAELNLTPATGHTGTWEVEGLS